MTRWQPVVRALSAAAFVGGVLAFGVPQDARADPEVCGYVKYSTDNTDPDETVPYVPYCERPCFPFVEVPPGHHGTIAWAALVCVKGL